ncbi:LysM domain protein [Aspergillus nomiae NRRL 13137]|uniref:LysM domain protein n=1 Tax=Aspergillus nomiae NRRL (strain ATCC 15546 / NRRL 13137 / CBS 260.88 / M93) TaxID=1509407 RepID=A0A0L1JG00_ASPN3|nr:LysM domain protein [Aspergillus nomiae NRRL 13137]KNG90689.1 LysM domain protein [Aspergillus nomiae NRRL 13137]
MSSSTSFADTLSPGTNGTSASRRSTSTVRSRPRRLVSFTDDESDNGRQLEPSGLSTTLSTDLPVPRSRGATPSPYTSRGASPMPMRHPSRVTPSPGRGASSSLGGFSYTGKNQVNFAESSRAAADFLDASWSSLQSLASSVLGSDIARPTTNGTPRTHTRKPSRPDSYTGNPSRTLTSSSWGPAAPSTSAIGAGTKEERQAFVQAKKREALLLADTETNGNLNTKHKRRDSSDRTGHLKAGSNPDEEALAYVHHVQPTDSITGVTIRYGCQPAIFRKANGFWPSDSIQGRKTVLLPVDSCSVKGRPIRHDLKLVDAGISRRDSLEDPSGSSIAPSSISGPRDQPEAIPDAPSEAEADQIWKHESWVQIDGFSAPVEIGRVPRRALGFFPRSRRKSISYTDSESPSLSGRERTPTLSSTSSTFEPQPSRVTSMPGNRPHADSRAGRGTLDRDAMAPGPALDGLSKFFAQHLPNLAPAPTPPKFQDSTEYTSNAVSNTPTGLDNIGGAVEGWVRKMTNRAKAGFNELQQSTQGHQMNGTAHRPATRGVGDLIELNDGLESRDASKILRPEYNRSGTIVGDGSSVRGRFHSPSAGTSRTRTTFKDD